MTTTTRRTAQSTCSSWPRIALLVAVGSTLASGGYLYASAQQVASLPVAFAAAGAATGAALTAIEANQRLQSAFESVPDSVRTAAFVLGLVTVVTFLSAEEAATTGLGFGGGVIATTALALAQSRLRA